MSDLTCDSFDHISAELALGLADAHERAGALAHLERCALCRAEIRQLSDVADALAAMAPPAEPPAGFESRVLDALAELKRPPSGWRFPLRRVLQVAAALAAVGLIGGGGWLVGESGSPPPTIDAGHLATAKLMSAGQPVGDVVVDDDGTPWMSMEVEMAGARGRYVCQVVTAGGHTATVGFLQIVAGRGVWAAALPTGSAGLRAAQLVDARGRVLATASFHHS